ncbi:MAG TPA: succinyldiaminopimelate transaminase [Dermatophilaceae bacterium]|nr:succinyldiaminopimelate transaminase [Dermatophilaceae bacterium]
MSAPLTLPDFPWDTLRPYADLARRHPGGIVDLSVGTPVDPTPDLLQRALAAASDAPGYPTTVGTPALREAVCGWFARRRAVPGLRPEGVIPTIGSKELVAWLPTLLGLGRGDLVGLPAVAYPTYDVGARLARATPVVVDLDDLPTRPREIPALVWVNSPSNPTGAVLGLAQLRAVVEWARSHGVVVASDECYAELDWRPQEQREGLVATPSILHPQVCGGSHEGLLAVYSLSKQSSLAGYRAAFVAGDESLVGQLLEVRKHAGMMVPGPVQAVLTVALGDDAHVADQRERYRRRREILLPALARAGLRVDRSEAGLYLWATRTADVDGAQAPCWETTRWLADRGILVAPGSFYGDAGRRHIRMALTASDERIARAAERLG